MGGRSYTLKSVTSCPVLLGGGVAFYVGYREWRASEHVCSSRSIRNLFWRFVDLIHVIGSGLEVWMVM